MREDFKAYLTKYYSTHDEDVRLLSQHGQVEYLTTMKYIEESLQGISEPKILEIGAGTGRYSIALVKQGYNVTAVELLSCNLDILTSKLDGFETITAIEGDALDLSNFDDNSFDLTLVLGPMYHLYTKEDKVKALSEAVRVTKPERHIMVAYCMNEAPIIQFCFLKRGLLEQIKNSGEIADDWHTDLKPPYDLFHLVRVEDIAYIDSKVPVGRVKLIATDGATEYNKESVDSMDDYMFGKWLEFHLATCERQDIIGASNHTLDILKKI